MKLMNRSYDIVYRRILNNLKFDSALLNEVFLYYKNRKTKFEKAKSSHDFWNMGRKIQGKRKCSKVAIKGEDAQITTNPKEKAASFDHSCKMGEYLKAKI